MLLLFSWGMILFFLVVFVVVGHHPRVLGRHYVNVCLQKIIPLFDLWSELGVVDGSLSLVLFKVVNVHLRQLAFLSVVGGRVFPSRTGVEDGGVDAGQRDGHLKAKEGVGAKFGVVDGTVKNGVDASAGRVDAHTLADTVGSAGPSGIDQVGVRSVLVELVLQQVRIPGRMEGHKSRAKAGRKSGGRFLDATFGARHLGRVSRQELVHGLAGTQLDHGGQNAKGITREKDDIIGVTSHLGLVL
jgi:hypothetical protein